MNARALAVIATVGGIGGPGCGPTASGQDPGGGSGATDAAPGSPDAAPRPDAPPGEPQIDAGPCTDVVDVVFVLDTSSSMSFVLTTLAEQIPGVVAAANRLAPDAHFGLIAFQDNHRLDATGPLESGRVHTAAATLQTAFRYYLRSYSGADRNPGDPPTGPTRQNPVCEENSLDALYAAAVDFPWRPNATRVVIVATDDTFLESPDNYGDRDADGDTSSTDYPREGDYPAHHRMAETVSALQDRRIRVFSFTRLTKPGLFEACETPRRFDWPHITDGWTTPYRGAEPIPAATDGDNFDVAAVQAETLSLAETINRVVLDSYCVPPVVD